MRMVTGLLVVCTAILIITCQKDFVTGRSTFSMLSEAQEVELGRTANKDVLDQYGRYTHGAINARLSELGQQIAATSHRPNLEYTFQVVDSPVVNAFALPGGYVYFTRGILAHFNTEAEMVGVLGHEVGHVVARHGAEQYSRAQLAQIGLSLGVALSETFRDYAGYAQLGTQLLFLRFSRKQESESDRLGVEYACKLGFDGHQMAHFFETIQRLQDASGQSIPNFLSTHPNPVNRQREIERLADDYAAQGYAPTRATTRSAYLDFIRGITFGEDPKYGYIESNRLYVPNWRLQFQLSDQYDVVYQRQAVHMSAGEGKAIVVFTTDDSQPSAKSAMRDFAQRVTLDASQAHNLRYANATALSLAGPVDNNGQALQVDCRFWEHAGKVHVAYGFALQTDFPAYRHMIETMLNSISPLNSPAYLNRAPSTIEIRKARTGGRLRDILRGLNVSLDDLEAHAILNGMGLDERLDTGTKLKIIHYP